MTMTKLETSLLESLGLDEARVVKLVLTVEAGKMATAEVTVLPLDNLSDDLPLCLKKHYQLVEIDEPMAQITY